MLALMSSILNKEPMQSSFISIRKGNLSCTLSAFISMPVRCVSHAEACRVAKFCRGGIYSMDATAKGVSSARAKSILAHRITLFLLIRVVLGNENACSRWIVRLVRGWTCVKLVCLSERCIITHNL